MARPSARRPMHAAGDPWLAVVLHELRNPLQPLRGALLLARHRCADDLVVQRCLDAAERQLGLLQRLLDDLARLDADACLQPLRMARVSMRGIVEQAALTAGLSRGAQARDVSCAIDTGSHDVHGDADRLLQVVLNLLSNALKYTPRRGRVEVLLGRSDGDVVFQVRDDGCGLAAEELGSIFQPFMRGRPAGAVPGLGVGLAVVRLIVERHGGSVQAASPGPGLGSTFAVRLPGYAGRRAPGAARRPHPLSRGVLANGRA